MLNSKAPSGYSQSSVLSLETHDYDENGNMDEDSALAAALAMSRGASTTSKAVSVAAVDVEPVLRPDGEQGINSSLAGLEQIAATFARILELNTLSN